MSEGAEELEDFRFEDDDALDFNDSLDDDNIVQTKEEKSEEIEQENKDEEGEEDTILPGAPTSKRVRKVMSTEQVQALPDHDEYEKELAELRQHQLDGEAQRLQHSDQNIKLSEEDISPITIVSNDDQEFFGLVEEVPLEKRKKRKTKGKVRKRPPAVNFDLAADIIRIPRQNNKLLGEGDFSEELPDELEGIVSFFFIIYLVLFIFCYLNRFLKRNMQHLFKILMKFYTEFLQ